MIWMFFALWIVAGLITIAGWSAGYQLGYQSCKRELIVESLKDWNPDQTPVGVFLIREEEIEH